MKRLVHWLLIAAASALAAVAVVFIASYLACAGQYAVAATTADDPALPGRNIGDYRFHLEVRGLPTRPVLVVVHGGLGGDYRALLPLGALSDEYQVVFYDRRGTGLSPRAPERELGFARHVSDLGAVIEAVSPHSPVRLIGDGVGALLVAAYLERHSGRVSHAALAGAPQLAGAAGRSQLELLAGGGPPPSLAWAEAVWRSLFQSLYVYGPDADARRDFRQAQLEALSLPGDPRARLHCGSAASQPPSWRPGARAAERLARELGDEGGAALPIDRRGLKRHRHPVLLLAGSCDRVFGPEAQRQNLRLFSSAELVVVEGAGHALFHDQPAASLARLRRYLRRDHSALVARD